MATKSSDIEPWKRKSSRLLAECRIFDLKESLTISPLTGNEHQFYFVETADWVNIVPITDNNEVVCVRQFRHGNEGITLEIPGGMVDAGEDPCAAAIRECLEETGYEVKDATPLGTLAPNPALFGNQLYTYVARSATQVTDIANSATEHTEVVLIPVQDLPGILTRGEIDHALVVATLWRLLYELKA